MTTDRNQGATAAALFLLALICCLSIQPSRPGDNANSRLDLTAAILNERSLSIDPYHYNTIDKAEREGRFYTDKAPGSSMLALVPAIAVKAFSGGVFQPESPAARAAVTLALSALPTALLTVLLWRAGARLSGDEEWSLAAASAYALGSLAFPYSSLFYGHQAAAAMGFAAFLFAGSAGGPGAVPWKSAALGLLLGFSVILEYPMALIAVPVGLSHLLNFRRADREKSDSDGRGSAGTFSRGPENASILRFAAMTGGAALPLAAWAAYNMQAFGEWAAFGYEHERLDYFRAGHRTGLVGLGLPGLDVLYRISIHPGRGLFYLCPAALLGAAGFVVWFKSGRARAEAAASLAIVLLFFLFNASIFNPEGGMALGPRYLLPALPWLFLPASFLGSRMGSRAKSAAAGLILASVALMSLGAVTDPHVRQEFRSPLWEFCLPLLQAGATATTAPFLNVVPAGAAAAMFFILTLGAAYWAVRPKAPLIAFAVAAAAALIHAAAVPLAGSVAPEIRLWILGKTALDSGRTEAGENFLDRAIETNPRMAEPYFTLGLSKWNRGKKEAAESLFQQAVDRNPDFVEARYNLGLILTSRGENDRAAVEFERVLEKADPAFQIQAPAAALMLGRRWLLKDDCAKARAYFEKALAPPTTAAAMEGIRRCGGRGVPFP